MSDQPPTSLLGRLDQWRQRQPIRRLVFTWLLLTVTALLAGQSLLAHNLFGRRIKQDEVDSALERTAVLAQSVGAAKSRLMKTLTDYAGWGVAYRYACGQLPAETMRSVLDGPRLDRLMLDAEAILDVQGHFLIGHRRDPRHSLSTLKPGLQAMPSIPLTSKDYSDMLGSADVAQAISSGLPASGYSYSQGRLWVWTLTPVTADNKHTEYDAWWIGARDLKVVIDSTTNRRLAGERRMYVLPNSQSPGKEPQVVSADDELVVTQVAVGPVNPSEELILEVHSPRKAYQAFRGTTLFFTLTAGLIGLTLLAVLMRLLDRSLLQPLSRLSQRLDRLVSEQSAESAIDVSDASPEIRRVAGAVESALESSRARREAELARDAALEANRLRSEFTATLTHELRTPLHGIIGMTELLAHAELPEIQRGHARVVHNAAVGLKAIVDDALMMSTLQAGRLQLHPTPTDLRHMLTELLELQRTEGQRKGLSLQLEIDPQLLGGHLVDALRLRQILGNLLGNAVKFTTRGWVKLQLQVVWQDEQRSRLQFVVADSGPGMSREFSAQAFDTFAQGAELQGAVNGGVGLGLAIVRELAGMMGGEVTVDTELGRGSSFGFVVELTRTELQQQQSQEERGQPGRQVLLVDDNDAAREVSAALLEHLGCGVTSAGSGAQALAAYAQSPMSIELVLMDVRMPDMDGCETTRRLREWEREHQPGLRVRIVALSANSSIADERAAFEAGMDGYLVKPVRLADLQRALNGDCAPQRSA